MLFTKSKMSMMVLIIGFVLSVFSAQASSAIVFGNDQFKFTGEAYLDTTSLVSTTQGIGRVTTISQGSDIIYNYGDGGQFLNFVFADFETTVSPVAPIFNFVATGGFVDFYLTTNAGLFNTSVSSDTEIQAIINDPTRTLFLSTTAHGNTVGINTGPSYASSGYVDVTGGLYANQLNTNSRPTFIAGDFADLNFGLTGVNNQNPLVHADYSYITSADAQGASTVPVPEPVKLFMLGTGLLYIGLKKRKENFTSYIGNASIA